MQGYILRMFENRCGKKYLELRGRKRQQGGENCKMRLIIRAIIQACLG
jgi:hypothetical protein